MAGFRLEKVVQIAKPGKLTALDQSETCDFIPRASDPVPNVPMMGPKPPKHMLCLVSTSVSASGTQLHRRGLLYRVPSTARITMPLCLHDLLN